MAAAQELWLNVRRHPRVRPALGFLKEHWLPVLAGVSLTGLVIAVDPLRLVHLFLQADRRSILLMLPCTLAIYLFRSVAWWVTLRRIGADISLPRTIFVMFAGRTLMFIPTGDLARIPLVKEAGDTSANEGAIAGTIAFQELMYMMLVGLGVLPRIQDHPELILLVAAMISVHVGIFAILIWKRFYDWAVGVVERVRLLRRFDAQLRSLRPAFIRLTTPAVVAQALLWNAIAVFFLLLLFHLAVTAVAGPRLGFTQTTFAYALGHNLGGLSLLPSGLGAMEAIVAGLLVTQGLPFYKGVAGVILFRAANDVFSAVAGAGATLVIRGWIRRGGRRRRSGRRRTRPSTD